MKVVALICRLSPRPDENYAGLKLQEKWGREYAEATWPGVPVEVFADEGVSASDGSERPGLERFLDWLAEGRIAHVWATEQSRVSRETEGRYPWFMVAAEMEAAGVTVLHTRRNGIMEAGGEMAGFQAVMSKAETRRLKRRVNEVRDDAREAGNLRRVLGGVPTLGYAYAKGAPDWHTEPGAAAFLREVAARVLADPENGVRAAYQAAIGGHRDVRDAAGRVPTEKQVREALQRPATAGLITERGAVRKTRTGRRSTARGDGKVTGRAAAIGEPPLDEQTWRDLERVFRGRKRQGRAVAHDYALGPLLRCGKCGNQLSGAAVKYRGESMGYYRCANPHPRLGIARPCRGVSIPADDVNLLIRTAVEAWAAEPGSGFAAASQARAGQSAERDRVAAELADVRRRYGTLAAEYGRGGIDHDQWATMQGERDATVARIEHQLDALAATLAEPPLPAEVHWDARTGEERRALAGRALQVPIKVAPGNGGARALTAADRITLTVRR